MTSSSDLKDLIKTNFHDDIKTGDDVGYMVGTEVIRVRTEEDLKEMWGEVRKNWCTTLWCDGLVVDESSKSNSNKSSKPGRKRKRAASDEESDDEATSSHSTKTQKEDR